MAAAAAEDIESEQIGEVKKLHFNGAQNFEACLTTCYTPAV